MSTPGEYATDWQDAAIRFTGVKKARKSVRDLMLSAMQLRDRPSTEPFLRCVCAHYVFDNEQREFEEIISMLKGMGTFVTTEEALAMLRGDQPIDGQYFHLSFDDGFRNVITNALPILTAAEVPSLMFAPTAWIGADWNVARDYSVDIAKYEMPVQMASWEELRIAAAAGMEIGSHSRTHTRLSTLSSDPAELEREIAGSKAEIEAEIGAPCRYIAYPYGKPGDYDDITLDAVRRAGYEAGFAIHRGRIESGVTDPMMIPRHHFEPEWPRRHIKYFANGNMEEFWAKKVALAGVGAEGSSPGHSS